MTSTVRRPEAPTKSIGARRDIKYEERLAVRVIAQNDKNQIILVHAQKDDYYKLPGGGIEAGEDHAIAARREVLEETGWIVNVGSECVGVVEEWRNDLHQFSYCYVGRLENDTGRIELTEEEVKDGLKYELVGVGEVVERMKGVKPTSELGRFIQERDVFFVETCLQEMD